MLNSCGCMNLGVVSGQNRILLPPYSLCGFCLLYFCYEAIPGDSIIYPFILFGSGFVFTPPHSE